MPSESARVDVPCREPMWTVGETAVEPDALVRPGRRGDAIPDSLGTLRQIVMERNSIHGSGLQQCSQAYWKMVGDIKKYSESGRAFENVILLGDNYPESISKIAKALQDVRAERDTFLDERNHFFDGCNKLGIERDKWKAEWQNQANRSDQLAEENRLLKEHVAERNAIIETVSKECGCLKTENERLTTGICAPEIRPSVVAAYIPEAPIMTSKGEFMLPRPLGESKESALLEALAVIRSLVAKLP